MSGDIQDQYCTSCYILEKELNQKITKDYPISKFMVMLEEVEKDGERQQKEMDKNNKGKTLR
jgi:hypothetical protein